MVRSTGERQAEDAMKLGRITRMFLMPLATSDVVLPRPEHFQHHLHPKTIKTCTLCVVKTKSKHYFEEKFHPYLQKCSIIGVHNFSIERCQEADTPRKSRALFAAEANKQVKRVVEGKSTMQSMRCCPLLSAAAAFALPL